MKSTVGTEEVPFFSPEHQKATAALGAAAAGGGGGGTVNKTSNLWGNTF